MRVTVRNGIWREPWCSWYILNIRLWWLISSNFCWRCCLGNSTCLRNFPLSAWRVWLLKQCCQNDLFDWHFNFKHYKWIRRRIACAWVCYSSVSELIEWRPSSSCKNIEYESIGTYRNRILKGDVHRFPGQFHILARRTKLNRWTKATEIILSLFQLKQIWRSMEMHSTWFA